MFCRLTAPQVQLTYKSSVFSVSLWLIDTGFLWLIDTGSLWPIDTEKLIPGFPVMIRFSNRHELVEIIR